MASLPDPDRLRDVATFAMRHNLVPGAVAGVRWIAEVMTLPERWRWAAPVSTAAVEDVFYRGVLLSGLIGAGLPPWSASWCPAHCSSPGRPC